MTATTITTDTPTALADEAEKRSAYTAGLRALAELLDEHPEVPLPYEGQHPTYARLSFHFLNSDDVKSELVTALRAFPGPKSKEVEGAYFRVAGKVHGLHYDMTAFRDDVCERIVTGTREITREVPDPDALAAVPTVTVTETVEDIEWECRPLLSEPVSA